MLKIRKSRNPKPAKKVVFAPGQKTCACRANGGGDLKRSFMAAAEGGDFVATMRSRPKVGIAADMPPQLRQMLAAPLFSLTPNPAQRRSTFAKGIVHIDERTELELRRNMKNPPNIAALLCDYDDNRRVAGNHRLAPLKWSNCRLRLSRSFSPGLALIRTRGAAAWPSGHRQDPARTGGRQ